MNPIPEAVTKSWLNHHQLYCAVCGRVAYIKTFDLDKAKKRMDAAWAQHLERKHSERKP